MFDMNLLQTAQFLLFRLAAAIIAVTLHEYSKAAASWRLGDNLPKLNGRITFNPLRHLEPLGTLLLVLFGFGWGRPTETSPMFYGNVKKSTLVVYALPLVVNLLVAVFAAFAGFAVYTFGAHDGGLGIASGIAHEFFIHMAVINAGLALINLLPIYPLDGWCVMELFLTAETKTRFKPVRKYMQLFLVALIITGLAGMVFGPIINALTGFSGL